MNALEWVGLLSGLTDGLGSLCSQCVNSKDEKMRGQKECKWQERTD